MEKPTGQSMPDGRLVKAGLPADSRQLRRDTAYSDSAESMLPNSSNVSPLKRDICTDWIG
jgi:hypothetical protein